MIISIESKDNIASLNIDRRKNYDKEAEKAVCEIIDNVRENKDKALFEYTKRFDGFDINTSNIRVGKEEFEHAVNSISEKDKQTIIYAKERIERFHEAAKQKSFFVEEDGIILGSRVTPCTSCGLYVPGGKAAYPSTALMTIIPAKTAGVDEIYVVSPAQNGEVNPYVLYAAYICGVTDVYKIGGAQAIAALAYSTQSVPSVDVIAGPGNIYVALAKKAVFGDVAIDSVAGPSEIMIVADSKANAEFAAYDLLSQAEHDEMARCYFIGMDKKLTIDVEKRFLELAHTAKRSSITSVSSKNALFFYAEDFTLAAQLVDKIAPEHLELQVRDPYLFMNSIRNAGAIFIGEYTPEPVGDYIAGPNHTLPTNHTARFASPLSSDVFMKKSSIIHYSKKAFKKNARFAADFAKIEGLFAHQASIEVRLNGYNKT